jgi:UDP-N-acetylmuramoylalanine--D-glutamate ligase
MTPDHRFRDYRGRRVTVMGLGSFGGGAGAVRFLAEQGADVTVTDVRHEDQFVEVIAELKSTPSVKWHLGRQEEADFARAELIVVNPAVRRDHPLLRLAVSHGIPLTSEMNLFWQHQCGRIVAVTGSNGKSTTTALIHSMLKQSGRRVWLGGNIGGSLLPLVDQIQSDDVVVLELSSFQLTDLDRLQVSPHVSVVTNFSPNHLDWHDTLDHYCWAKQTMLRWQSTSDVAVLNADDPDLRDWPVKGQRLYFGLSDRGEEGVFLNGGVAVCRRNGNEQEFPLAEWVKLPGQHNLANALAAAAAAMTIGATPEHVRYGLESYEPLPHRLQFIGEVAGRKFYNDSLATTPESAIVGVNAFTSPVILLAGGYDKHVDLSDMARHVARHAKGVALMGQTAKILFELMTQVPDASARISDPLSDFPKAFRWAWEQSTPGDVILLSPGCASYDWFRNFADRGIQFIREFETLAAAIDHNPQKHADRSGFPTPGGKSA